ncbi:MAG: hypothetical protein LBS86_06140 [Treponema sp.]|nr:hypothetical protein [Treponema sp.]
MTENTVKMVASTGSATVGQSAASGATALVEAPCLTRRPVVRPFAALADAPCLTDVSSGRPRFDDALHVHW